MPSITGTRLGPYQIGSLLGTGGMGEVYCARDTKLNREVALKIVPEAFACDAERMARFDREAQLLASLNHPNIASIFGLEDSSGTRALVMELVPGPTLADRIAQGPISLREALPMAKQIAEGLEYAHEHGIIHRDLKPANVKLTSYGAAKILDFGLAKALHGEVDHADQSRTIGVATTHAGMVLGTAAYMSPEQARGRPVDKRTDIWSFGCVVFEALTGHRAFPGETLTDILAAIVDFDPDWSELPAGTPKNIRALFERCLQKDPKQRLHDIADARIEIEETLRRPVKQATEETAAPTAGRRWAFGAAGLAGILVGALLAWGVTRMARSTEANVPHLASVARLTHDPDYSRSPTWSPDGTTLAFSSNRSGNYEIYVRRVQGGQEVNVTNDPGQDIQPAFSPDGNWIAFVSTRSSRSAMVQIAAIDFEFRTYGGDIWLVPALGGQARLLARDGNYPTWHPHGTKVLYISGAENHRALMEVTTDSGASNAVLPTTSSNWEIIRAHYSPDGRWITFETYERKIFIMSVAGGEPRQLLNGVSHVWDPSGHRIYYCTPGLSGGTSLFSVEIDESSGKLKGDPESAGLVTAILRELAISGDGRHVAATEFESSRNLTRLPLNASGDTPAGPEEVLSRGLVYDHEPAVSPDNRTVAYISDRLGHNQLWMSHLDTKRLERLQLPGSDTGEEGVQWFPDGQKLEVLRRYPDGKVAPWVVFADGSRAEELIPPREGMLLGTLTPVSPDGHTLTYSIKSQGFFQLFLIDLATRQSRQLTFTPGDKWSGFWSPDGHWLVFPSNADGAVQLWRIAAGGGTPEQITKGNDRIRHVFYSRDGRWLYFQPNHQNIYRMPATGGAVQQVTHFVDSTLFLEEPMISPDGRYLYYCRSNGGSSLWLLTVGTGKSESEPEK